MGVFQRKDIDLYPEPRDGVEMEREKEKEREKEREREITV